MTRNGIVLTVLFAAAVALFTLLANGPKGLIRRSTVDWSKVTDEPAETLTITWMGAPYYPNAKEGEWIETMLEKRFNIDLKPLFLDGEAYGFKKPMMFSGGLVPDVTWEADPINIQKDTRNGFIIEVPYDLILKYAPDYVKAVNTISPEAWMYSYYKEPGMERGINMGVPTTWAGGLYPPPGVWRLDWLKKVGISKTPETLDEMREAFRRFRAGNVGDQPANVGTCGMSGNMYTWWSSFSEIFCAFGVLPYNWALRGEKVLWGGVTPEAREALALLREWYAEGLIHPDFVTDRRPEVLRKFLNGKIGYVNWRGDWASLNLAIPNSLYQQIKEINPGAELTVGRFPIGPRGDRGFHVWGGGGNVMAFGRDCLQQPRKVIRVLKMWNERALDEQLMVQSAWGRRGEHWDFRLPMTDPKTGRPLIDPQTHKVIMDPTSGRENIGPYADSRYVAMKITGNYFMSGDVSMEWLDKYQPKQEVQFRWTYCNPRWARKDVFLKPDVVASAGTYLLGLRELQTVYYSDIIRGKRPLEDFEEFVQRWREQGGEQMTREANELHEDMKSVFRQVGAGSGRSAG